jgi:hypothetical protein
MIEQCGGPDLSRRVLSLIGDLTSGDRYQHDLMLSGQPNELSFALSRIKQIHDIVCAVQNKEREG